jgi:hypothetical protein
MKMKVFEVIEEGVMALGEMGKIVGGYTPTPCTTGNVYQSLCYLYTYCEENYLLWDSCGEDAYRLICDRKYSVVTSCGRYQPTELTHT